MVKFTVKQAAKARGCPTYYQLAKDCGVTITTARRWWADEMRCLPKDAISLLCDVYNLQPSDLIEYKPQPRKPKPEARRPGRGRKG